MRVGVYIDGYNLYYAGRRHCAGGTLPWKWFGPRNMIEGALASQAVRQY